MSYVPQDPDRCCCARDYARDRFCSSHDKRGYNFQADYHADRKGREGEDRKGPPHWQQSEGDRSPSSQGQIKGQQGLNRSTPPVIAGGALPLTWSAALVRG